MVPIAPTASRRGRLASWGADMSGILTVRYWGFFIAALVLSSGVAKIAYKRLDVPQTYPELIVGNITWAYENKFHDYAVLYALAFAFFASVAAIASLAVRVERVTGPGGAARLHDFFLILCIPAALWAGGLVTTRSASLDLLTLSHWCVAGGVLVTALLACRDGQFWTRRIDAFFGCLHKAALWVIFTVFAVIATGVAVNRLGARLHLRHWMSFDATVDSMRIVGVFAALLCGVLVAKAANPERLATVLHRLAMAAQCFLPLLLLCLVPPAWIHPAEDTMAVGYHLTAFANVLIVACIVAAYVELYRLHQRHRRPDAFGAPAFQSLGIGSAIGLLLFLKSTPISLPELMPDDYHFGELLVPWWSWAEMGLLPFRDYAPARGLMNYATGMLSSVIFGGATATVWATLPFVFAALALVALPVMRRSLGMGGAFVALLIGPFANGIGEIDIAVSIFLFAFCLGWLVWRRDVWLASFAACGIALLLYAPGQGALALLACGPLAAVALWSLYRADPRRLLVVLAAIAAVAVVLLAATPLGSMVLGALRYGAEQSQINSTAHGIAWRDSFGHADSNPWAFEAMRASFVLVVLWAGVLVARALCRPGDPSTRRVLAYAVPVLLIGLLFVIRAAGRIDAGASRLGIASVWAFAMLAPMLLFASVRVRGVHYFAWIAALGFLLPYSGSLAPSYASNFDPIDATPFDVSLNSRSIQGGRLGAAVAHPSHLARIVAVRSVLDQVLDPQETYLDLSGRHAMYYYVERRPPVESASTYNLVGERQQARAIRSLREAHLPAILLSADNIVHDGGPLSLRSNLVYREVLLSTGYRLATIGTQVWMIRDDRVSRLPPGEANVVLALNDPAALAMLDPIYRREDLEAVPASWGRSAASLDPTLSTVLQLPAGMSVVAHAVLRAGPDAYAITGGDPYVRFDIADRHLSGRQAGVMSFDFVCAAPDATPILGLYWSTPQSSEGVSTFLRFQGHQGRLIVPVDSAPSWLLAERIDSLRFDIEGDSAGCGTFSIRNITFSARRAVPVP